MPWGNSRRAPSGKVSATIFWAPLAHSCERAQVSGRGLCSAGGQEREGGMLRSPNDQALVSRAWRSAKRCAAEPGPYRHVPLRSRLSGAPMRAAPRPEHTEHRRQVHPPRTAAERTAEASRQAAAVARRARPFPRRRSGLRDPHGFPQWRKRCRVSAHSQ
jgi:hypothetical protein